MSLNVAFFNIWAILVCIIINMVLGALWYSPLLFGNIWLKLVNKKAEDISKEESKKAMSFAFIPAVINSVLLALILGFINAQNLLDAIIIGSILSAGFVGMSSVNLILFEDRKPGLALLNTGYAFAGFVVSAIILTLWH